MISLFVQSVQELDANRVLVKTTHWSPTGFEDRIAVARFDLAAKYGAAVISQGIFEGSFALVMVIHGLEDMSINNGDHIADLIGA